MDAIAIKDKILAASQPVMRISAIFPEHWYRKPSGPRRGPWYRCEYEILNQSLWKRHEECIYFVRDDHDQLRYVGISVNRLADRWRSSPAFDENLNSLGRNELFHSQCWPEICKHYSSEKPTGYVVSIIHGKALQIVLSELSHPLSCLGRLNDDADIAVIALEVWFVKRFESQLWNKRK